MRQYPRSVRIPGKRDSAIKVHNEKEEYEAGLKGYESHWNPEINEKRKGTDKEILRALEAKDEDLEATEVKTETKSIPENEERVPTLTRGQKAAATRKRNREKIKNG